MPLKRHKPTSPGRRFATFSDFAEITRSEPEKSLTEGISKSGGPNAPGRQSPPPPRSGGKPPLPQTSFKHPQEGGPRPRAAAENQPNPTTPTTLLRYRALAAT